MRHCISLVLACAAAMGAGPAAAVGFGRTTSTGALGQPLDFSATLRLAADEALERGCVSATVRAGDSALGADQVRVALRAAKDPGERVVRVTTVRALDEPVVTIEIAVGCSARMTRSFVEFLDPPQVQLARAGEAAVDDGWRRPWDATPSATIASVGDAKPPPRGPRRHAPIGPHAIAARPAAPVRALATASPTPHERRSMHTSNGSIAGRSPAAPRLRLDAPTVMARAPEAAPAASATTAPATGATTAMATSGPDAAAAASAADAERTRLTGELAQARARIQELEAGLGRVRGDEQALRQSMSALQARLRDAPGGQGFDRLVVLLGVACVLLIGAVAGLVSRRGGTARGWWEPTRTASVAQPPALPDEAKKVALDETPADAPFTYERPAVDARPASPQTSPAPSSTSFGGLEVTTVIDNALLARMAAGEDEPMAADADAAPIDLLIGLEQQADGFTILGQEARAVELLAAHLPGPAGNSPLPYLRLLALHRTRGDRAAHVRVAEALQARLGGELASWSDADVEGEEGLESHRTVLERLQRLWVWPAEAMRAIEGWVFRGPAGDDRFGLNAYADMLLLYGLARERVEADTGVDLLLPIEDTQPVEVEFAPTGFRFSRFGATDVPLRQVLEVDVSAPSPLDSRPSELRQAI